MATVYSSLAIRKGTSVSFTALPDFYTVIQTTVGTDTERPTLTDHPALFFNQTTRQLEYYNGFAWSIANTPVLVSSITQPFLFFNTISNELSFYAP